MTAPNMADMSYYFGIKLTAHPTQRQKNIIKRNSDASRFVYNVLIGIDQEMFQLKRVDLLHQSRHKDYQKLIDYFVEKKHVSLEFAKFMVEHLWYQIRPLRKQKLKNAITSTNFNQLVIQ